MRILGIETSCDETALALVEVEGKNLPFFNILKNVIASQIDVHKEYGGVVPGLAKREHSRNLVKVFYKTLSLNYGISNYQLPITNKISNSKLQNVKKLLERYPEMLKEFKEKVVPLKKPPIDLIAVTHGPGLEPALWVGINFARALSALWNIPLIGVDHMEGHIAVNLLTSQQINGEHLTFNNKHLTNLSNVKCQMSNVRPARAIAFPAIALAVSGGHTQLILVKNWMDYELLGETLDDAAGEAFDKVARMLDLPFPGGPYIEKIAKKGNSEAFDFPRPMIKNKDYNFSFSGLKTAVKYTLEKMTKKQIEKQKADLAASFQKAVTDVLINKTLKAAKKYNVKTVILAGGVAANQYIKKTLEEKIKEQLRDVQYLVPEIKLATDNGVMIAIAGYLRYKNGEKDNWKTLEADSNKLITE